MIDSPVQLNRQAGTPPLWKRIAEAFPHRHAMVSETELLTKPEKFDATESEIVGVLEWGKEQHLLAEVEDEPGWLRLTPQGRRLWRELMGEL